MKEKNLNLATSKLKGKIIAVSISRKKGIKKTNVSEVTLRENYGIIGDAHAGTENRQVSLLAEESIEKMRQKGLNVRAGDFAENITTQRISLPELKMGTKLGIGKDILLEITQIGKACHERCAIYYQAGDCVMPREGIFTRVVKGGTIKTGDQICIK